MIVKFFALAHRLFAALATVSIVLVQCVHLALSVAPFYKVEMLAMRTWRLGYRALDIGVLVVASVAPLMAAILLIRLWETSRRHKLASHLVAGAVTLFYVVSAILLVYRLETGVAFDLSILWFQFDVTYRTLAVLAQDQKLLIGIILALLAAHYYGVVRFDRNRDPRLPFRSGEAPRNASRLPVLASLVCLGAVQLWADNGIANLILEFRQPKSAAKVTYIAYFNDSINRNKAQSIPPDSGKDLPNLFIVQLESLNANLVGKSFTPRLVQAWASRSALKISR